MRANMRTSTAGRVTSSLTHALTDAASTVVTPIVRGVLWRIGLAVTASAAGLAAIYHLTVAGTMALELEYGAINARLIVGGFYLLVVFAAVAVMRWKSPQRRMREKRDAAIDAALASPRHLQIAMLIDAALAGFSAGKATAKS